MKTTDSLGHLNALKPQLREVLAEALDGPRLTWHSTDSDAHQTLALFEDEAGRMWACSIPSDGSPASFTRVD